MNKFKKLIFTLSSLSPIVMTLTAQAACPPGSKKGIGLEKGCVPDYDYLPEGAAGTPETSEELIASISLIIKWIQYGLFIAATVLVIIAAYDYLFSKGDAEKIKTAQATLIYAVIALVIGIIAGGLPRIIQSILGVS